ncbi:MAG: excinuclease ABC subunit UvrC [Ruminococcaceae bacterium]|nr:excinuclease ABC subunit UvrC [Oscillospiraceae bacterium]
MVKRMYEIEEKLKTLPDKSGVYIMKNSDGEIIYVGKAKILKNRVRQYFKTKNHTLKVARMVENIADFEYIITDSENEALILENNLIKENMPKYNILLKDDKTYPFIKITVNDDFPQIYVTRRVIRDGARYFGPYCSNSDLKEILELISEVFFIRKCKKHICEDKPDKRPCLYHQLGKCKAPCSGHISKEEYRKNVYRAIDFLNGKYDDITQELQRRMKESANEFDFETAAMWRDRINALSIINQKQKIVSATGSDCDAIAVYNADDIACVEVFFIRSGKVVGKEHYFLSNTSDSQSGEIISEFIKQYYDSSSFIPKEIIVQSDFDDRETIEFWLSEKTNRSVHLTVPKIGDKLKLISMISSNAKKEHSEHQLKIMRSISFKNNALTSLQNLTNLENPPLLIEAYDISNISGSAKVGAMVTFKDGKPCKDKYRNFKIKYVSGQDDYSCMKEVLERRIEKGLLEKEKCAEEKDCKFLPFPDLILIDGGEGHMNVGINVVKSYNLNIPVFGIVKDNHHRTNALMSENGQIEVDKSSETFMLLTQIQDEMHRRAITYHRKLRDNSTLKTELLKIGGIGEKKAKVLLKAFRSVKRIKDASFEEIASVNGIDKTSAENVYAYFNGR